MTSGQWQVKPSDASMRTSNPIRATMSKLAVKSHPEKEMISLSIGDPTLFGNLKIHQVGVDAVTKALTSFRFNGYGPSNGLKATREALAKRYSTKNAPLNADDVITASGASGALELAITALCNEGSNILLPKPGFPLYETIASNRGINVRFYDLIPEKGWEIDLEHLVSLIDDKTEAVLINNPSNPCGSNFEKSHIEALLSLLSQRQIPLISDEIYADMVWGTKFTPAADIISDVPILTIGGIAKQWLVPGWRVGWLMIHDRNGAFAEVRKGLFNLSCVLVGPNALIQGAIPEILEQTPESFYKETLGTLEAHAKLSVTRLQTIPGLKVIVPTGAMYIMVGIEIEKFKDIDSDLDFCEKLITEESVFVLPGACFRYPNYFRIVTTPPPEKLEEAYERIAAFCKRHQV